MEIEPISFFNQNVLSTPRKQTDKNISNEPYLQQQTPDSNVDFSLN